MKRKSVLFEYINKYKITFIIIISLFLIGVLIGVIYINMSNEEKIENLSLYVTELINNVKNNISKTQINSINSIFKNSREIIIIWFLGCTVIGSCFVYIAITYHGFKIGYTIATFIYILGTKKGMIVSLSSLLLQNVIYIPTLFLIAESSIKMCKQTYKNRNNIKKEFIRHLLVLMICLVLGIVASCLEICFSTKILNFFKEIL